MSGWLTKSNSLSIWKCPSWPGQPLLAILSPRLAGSGRHRSGCRTGSSPQGSPTVPYRPTHRLWNVKGLVGSVLSEIWTQPQCFFPHKSIIFSNSGSIPSTLGLFFYPWFSGHALSVPPCLHLFHYKKKLKPPVVFLREHHIALYVLFVPTHARTHIFSIWAQMHGFLKEECHWERHRCLYPDYCCEQSSRSCRVGQCLFRSCWNFRGVVVFGRSDTL